MKTSFGEFSLKELTLSVALALGILMVVWFIIVAVFV